jgi:cellulose synthase/poly-beta-1,6-N-acetylglucosamine synthase-like glycosyltransferase
MTWLALTVLLAPIALVLYAYVVYPAILWLVGRTREPWTLPPEPPEWPSVSITVPAYNTGAAIRPTLDHLLAIDYPRDRLQIVVISDASSDGTDELVKSEYGSRGVELIRLPQRMGKTAAENIAVGYVRGEIIVNVDATILIPPASLKPLVRAFGDPDVGVASGRDVSVGAVTVEGNQAESGYVGYEMRIRELETRMGSIVGASGCFYGIRREVHAEPLPVELSWDFASALVAREHGFRSVSVAEAVCIVPRAKALRTELRRKVRTMARGLSTLFYKRALMDPMRYGSFAFMLASHKLMRWLPYLVTPFAFVALGWLALEAPLARWLLAGAVLGIALGIMGIRWPQGRAVPRVVSLFGFALAAFTAGFLAWVDAIRQKRMPTWEPTPRPGPQPS